MKTIMLKMKKYPVFLSVLLLLGVAFAFSSCKENISEDAYAIKTKKTLDDYLVEKGELSSIKAIFDEVKLGISDNASVVSSVLSARGNYTVFAPTNDAIAAYIKEVTGEESTDLSKLTYAQKQAIALNCIIDNGDNTAYELADFPVNGNFATTNLRDRRIFCKQNAEGNYVLNDVATIIAQNMEASNGMLHEVDHVIVPSDKSIADLLKSAGNMRVMSKLVDETGFADSLTLKTTEEDEFEKEHLTNAGTIKTSDGIAGKFSYQSKRAIGYTAFVEPDEVLNADWGIPMPNYVDGQITNWDEILSALKTKCEAIYGTEDADNLKSPNNAIYKFMAYHVLDGKVVMEDRSAVHHWNEYGYKCGENYKVKSSENYKVDVWDYFTTKLGSLVKITHFSDQTQGDRNFYLNRVSEYNTTWKGGTELDLGNYAFKRVLYPNNGQGNGLDIKVSAKNIVGETTYVNDGANGYYFPINHVMVNGDDVKNALSSERMRIDFSTLLPELLSNDIRGNKYAYFPQGYFKNITHESTSTEVYYLQEAFSLGNFGWKDYQGDEIIVTGQYDLVVKLPRVPKSGTYELRIASSNNRLRGFVQVYLGTSPNRTNPVGLPIDMRETVGMIPGSPWVNDKVSQGDQATCLENDRNLRNQGYMKGPQYFHKDGKDGSEPVRNIEGNSEDAAALRRILTAQHFDANQTYYLRFKSAIPDYSNSQLFLDYLELVPSSVYNGTTPEDVW